jgi:hypothetical protein
VFDPPWRFIYLDSDVMVWTLVGEI